MTRGSALLGRIIPRVYLPRVAVVGAGISIKRACFADQAATEPLGFTCIMPGRRLNLSHRVGEASSAVPADRDWRLRINCKAEWPPEPASSLVQV